MATALTFDGSGNATFTGTIRNNTAAGVITSNSSGLLSSSNGTNGQIIMGGGTGPVWGTLQSSGGSISVSTGTNSCSVDISNYVARTSWTPVLSFGGASVGITYGTQSGYYCRFGSVVFFCASIVLTNKGSSTGNMAITGLGFTPVIATSISLQTGQLTYIAGEIQCATSGSSLILVNTLTSSLVTILTNAFFNNTTSIQISGTLIL